jgi:ABC-type multidrug transport system ATPase subunit
VRAGLFHVMEGRHVFEDLTVQENLVAATYALTGAGPRRPTSTWCTSTSRACTSAARGLAGYLSGGEQQMLAIGRALIARPKLMLLDEPSLGLSPVLVEEIFEIIARINAERGVSMLLVEQNASIALAVAHYGYIMETGKVVIDNTAEKLAADPDVREFYLGMGSEGGNRSFKELKHYKRRKRWLSRLTTRPVTAPFTLTLPQALRHQAQHAADRIAIRQKRHGIWKPLTWAQLHERAVDVGLGLARAGHRAGRARRACWPRTGSSGCCRNWAPAWSAR